MGWLWSGLTDQEAMRLSKERDAEALRRKTPTEIIKYVYGQSMVDKYDLNKNGTLEDIEYASLESDLRKLSEARYQIILKRYDLNKDGFLNEEEKRNVIADQDAGKLTKESIDQELKSK